MYIVCYSGGSWDDYYTEQLFVTRSKRKAEKYVKRFDSIIEKYKEFYTKFEESRDDSSFASIKEENIAYFDRWNWLSEINSAYFKEFELR